MVGRYRFAGITVEIHSLHGQIHRMCEEYRITDAPVDITIRVSQADVDEARKLFERVAKAEGRNPGNPSDSFVETIAVHGQIAEALPAYGSVLMHGSCLAVDGAAYLFCAPSGTGKSTHARLWREMLGDRVLMVNDDKPLIRVADGRVLACGTPWNGKHHLSANVSIPLRAICLLERGERNEIERLSYTEGYHVLMRHLYRPFSATALARSLGLFNEVLSNVELWRLRCTMDAEAARVSYEALHG